MQKIILRFKIISPPFLFLILNLEEYEKFLIQKKYKLNIK